MTRERLLLYVRRLTGAPAGLAASTMTLPRWLAAATAALLFAISVALALVGVPEAAAGPGDVFANLGRNLVTTLALALLAYLWFYVWTGYHATHRLRLQARVLPESLFPVAPRVGKAKDVFGRTELIQEIATNLSDDFRTAPQVVVGDTGSGKTSLLLGLAGHFASKDVVPIVLSLRDAEEIDFAAMAEQRFKEYIDPHVRTAADADKLWRWMCRRGQVVLLADDLDRARVPGMAADPYKTAARVALDAARRRNMPLVVTSRPEGVPPELGVPPIELGGLELREPEAVEEVLARAGRREEEGGIVRSNIERGKLVDSPFYLGLIADLLRLRSLQPPPDGGEHAVRVALLSAWRSALLGGDTVPEDERRKRAAILERLDHFAADRLAPESESASVGAAVRPESKWLDAVHAGEWFGVLEVDDEGLHRFKHEVMHAYFASRILLHDRGLLRDVMARAPDAPRVQLALALAAAASRDAGFCREVCDALLLESAGIADERRLLRAVAAAEVAQAGEFAGLNERIVSECLAARRDATPVVRRAALEHLAQLAGPRAIQALWAFAGDDDYDVRWMAAEKLVERCSADASAPPGRDEETFVAGAASYEVIAAEIERSLAPAKRLDKPRDDWTPEIVTLKHIGWILPALRTRIVRSHDRQLSGRVAQHLGELLARESKPVTHQRGLEASIAQGFKADAQLNRGGGVDPDALDLLQRARFWYSRLCLLHAVAVRVAYGGELPQGARRVKDLLPEREHPFVAAAAELCERGLDEVRRHRAPEIVDRYVWADEGKLVARRPAGLVPEAIQLVGEIVLLLNMNETGGEREREAFGERDDLPYCIAQSTDRSELTDGCVDEDGCTFRLCPYQPAVNRLSAHREVSRAFCRHQRLNATHATARLWGARVHKRGLQDLWSELERKART